MANAICCPCSREKRSDAHPLPARERYLGSHITLVGAIADQEKAPFFILSGMHGLITADHLIPPYDYKLSHEDAPKLAELLAAQLAAHHIRLVHFYTKSKPGWLSYGSALKRAVETLGIPLVVHPLRDHE